MFDLLDTLTSTTKPDYRSASTLNYRMSKPAAYYMRQCKVRKAKPTDFPAHELGPKALPSVEALLKGVQINAYGQIHSCGWYLGGSGGAKYGDPYFGSNGAKTLEDCVAKFHAAVVEKRAKVREPIQETRKVEKFALGKSYSTPESVKGSHESKLRTWLALVGGNYVGCSTHSVPMVFEKVIAWDTCDGWVATQLNCEAFIDYEMAAPVEFQVVKGATHYGVFHGVACAWKVDKDADWTTLWEGDAVELAHEWICAAEVLFAYNGGKAPKQASFQLKPSAQSHTAPGVMVDANWLVLPLNTRMKGGPKD